MPHNSLPATTPAASATGAASDALASLDTQAFLARLLSQQTPFGELAVVSSFGAESAVLLHLVATLNPETRVVFLDTGFHFPETLAYRDELIARLGLQRAQTIGIDPLSEKRYDDAGTLHQVDPDGLAGKSSFIRASVLGWSVLNGTTSTIRGNLIRWPIGVQTVSQLIKRSIDFRRIPS